MKTGDLVVCVNDHFDDVQKELIPNRPHRDNIYTIRDLAITRRGRGVYLEEITNPPLEHPSGLGAFEPNFSIDRFRLLADSTELVAVKKEEAVAAE